MVLLDEHDEYHRFSLRRLIDSRWQRLQLIRNIWEKEAESYKFSGNNSACADFDFRKLNIEFNKLFLSVVILPQLLYWSSGILCTHLLYSCKPSSFSTCPSHPHLRSTMSIMLVDSTRYENKMIWFPLKVQPDLSMSKNSLFSGFESQSVHITFLPR